jgi:hypothetical protein
MSFGAWWMFEARPLCQQTAEREVRVEKVPDSSGKKREEIRN